MHSDLFSDCMHEKDRSNPHETTINLWRATTFRRRLVGLLGRKNIHADEAVWFEPCRAIHTFRMQFDLAIHFLDKKHHIIESHARVAPGRVLICWRARSVVEMGALQGEEKLENQIKRIHAAIGRDTHR